MAFRHTVTLVTSEGDPEKIRSILADNFGSMVTVVDTQRSLNRQRLINLAVWAAGEQAKQELGLPSEWNQSQWLQKVEGGTCGTACCIAGKVALEDGGKPLWDWRRTVGHQVELPAGEVANVNEYAAGQLGLDEEEASQLFRDFNELDDVLRLIKHLLNGEPLYNDAD